jgi:serine phosphatase RsbU (regulator of sigma subunit)
MRMPVPTRIPQLARTSVAAQYRAARTGGDFFDFCHLERHLVFFLADIAGRRDQALAIAAAMQDVFHPRAAELFEKTEVNEADALSDLTITLNQAIMQAAQGVRCAPAFIGVYDEELGTLFYINAGHPPAVLRESGATNLLHSNGLPLGLFSHATHDAQTWVLAPGASLVLASKGLVESRMKREEFGIPRLQATVESAYGKGAEELCAAVLAEVERFSSNGSAENDVTAVALVRSSTQD